MMMLAATFALSMRGEDVLGSWIYCLSPKYGFQYCVIAITVTYALILPVIPFTQTTHRHCRWRNEPGRGSFSSR